MTTAALNPHTTISPPARGAAAPSRFAALDLFRGLAALWVFMFHVHDTNWFHEEHPNFPQEHPVAWRLLDTGDRAVPMFFVISGYCLAMAAARARKTGETVFSFTYRRAKRIYPTFWCSIVLILWIKHWRTLYHGWDWVKIVTLTQIFDSQAGFFWGRFMHLNGAYWTLAIEFQFYLIVAASLPAHAWFYRLLAAVTLPSLLVYAMPDLWSRVAATGVFLPWWPWFGCGLLLYWILERGWGPRRLFDKFAPAASLAGVATIVVTAAVTTLCYGKIGELAFAGGFTVLLWFISALDAAVTRTLQGKSWLPSSLGASLATLGAMSYSLYLVHNDLSAMLAHSLRHRLHQGPWFTDILVIAGTLLLCYPFYLFCEAPLLARRRNKTPGPEPQQSLSAADLAASPQRARAA